MLSPAGESRLCPAHFYANPCLIKGPGNSSRSGHIENSSSKDTDMYTATQIGVAARQNDLGKF